MPLILMILVVVLDRITKLVVVKTMTENMSIPIIKDILHLTYILNPGAAFGMLEYSRVFFISLTMVILACAVIFRKKIQQETPMIKFGGALFLGGAIGNLVDRIKTGLVIDFIDFRVWPIFNVADIAICVGVGLIVWSVMREESHKEK